MDKYTVESFLAYARDEFSLTDLAAWLKTEDGLRAQLTHHNFKNFEHAKAVGLVKALAEASADNCERLWREILLMCQDVCQSHGALWEAEAMEMAEREIVKLGYFPPHWTYEQRATVAAEAHADAVEELERMSP